MKYSLECDVNGKVIISKQVEVTKGSKNFIFIADNKSRLSSIKIIVDVTDLKPSFSGFFNFMPIDISSFLNKLNTFAARFNTFLLL